MGGATPATGRILAVLGSADGAGVVRIEDRYDTGIGDLWSAITDPARLARWYGEVSGDLHEGGTFSLRIEQDGWEGTGRVEECDAPHRLVVTTRESDGSWQEGQGAEPFDEVIDATLSEDPAGCALVLEIRGLPLDKIQYYGVGWQIHAENLAGHVAGRNRGDTEGRWADLLPAYEELASRIG